MRKVVVYMGDGRIYHMMETAAKSLLSHNKVDRVYFLTDSMDFPSKLPAVIQRVNVHNQKFFNPNNPNLHSHYGYMTWMRAALSKIFQFESRVLLLDPDTLVEDDISALWDIDLTDYYFAAVQETRNHRHEKNPYFNAGVMLMNLDKLRKDGMDDKLIYEINTVHHEHLEQDVINFLCDGKILPLSSEYNCSFVTDPTPHPRIVHYLSRMKDRFYVYGKQYENKSWEEVLVWQNQ